MEMFIKQFSKDDSGDWKYNSIRTTMTSLVQNRFIVYKIIYR